MSESKHTPTKREFEKGWKHLLACINFGKSCFDAEAIAFMNEFPSMIMDLFDSHNALLKACKAALEFIGRSSKTDWDNEITPILEAAITLAEKK